MKLTILFLIATMVGVYATDSYAQNTKLTLNADHISIENLLGEIESQTEFRFFYNENVKLDKTVSVTFHEKNVSQVLDEVLAGSTIGYKIIDRLVALYVKGQGEFTFLSKQTIVIKGKVTDTKGDPLPGVNVVEKGTTNGAVTDLDGEYSISVSSPDAVLSFSYVGFLTEEVEAANQSTINLTMIEDIQALDEVVVVGYGMQKKATLTGSIGTIKSENFVQRPVANTTELLQGQVSGLITRQGTGLPGQDGVILNIRGFGNPLVIVDGIESSIDQVNPNDIESISILKDASAAVYGARAGNGVILVTTRRGSEKESEITYHGTVSYTGLTFTPKMVNARQWAEMMYESGVDPDEYSPNHVHYDPGTKTLTNTVDGSEYKGYDWFDAMYREWAPQQQHNISASGGSQIIKYFISAGFTDQESNFKSGDYDYDRYNIRSNIDARIADKLNVSIDFSYRRGILDKANFDAASVYENLSTAKPVYPYIHEADPTRAATSGFLNRTPYYQIDKDYAGSYISKSNNIYGGLEFEYTPSIKGLTAKARLNYEETFSWNKTIGQIFDVYDYDEVAAANGGDPWILFAQRGNNTLSVYSARVTKLVPLVSLEYDQAFGDHHFTGKLIGEMYTYNWTSLKGDRENMLSYESPYLIYASEEGKDNAENVSGGKVGKTEAARSSIIGRINYDYKGKYLFEFLMRADASAEYAPENRWGYFPSISAGWRISEESYIKDKFGAINNLKLRASYGILGNDAISSFDYLQGYNIATEAYVFGSSSAPIIASSGLANPNITWETMKISNIGMDGTFLDGIIGFEIDAFYRLREDILATPIETIPSTFGASLPKTNLNKRDNRGFEITLTHLNRIGGFSYNISPTFSWSRGKYVELQEEISDDPEWNARYLKEGQWDDRVWGYVFDGFFETQEEIDNHPIDQDQAGNQSLKVGDLKYKDLNGDNYIDWRDEKIIGKGSNSDPDASLPNIMYGMNIGVQYKGFALNMLWQGAADYIVSFHRTIAAPFSNESVPYDYHYKYRAIIGVDGNGNEYITNPDQFELPPVNQVGRNANNSKTSDFWSYNARFIRLKNLNISYTIPEKLVKKAGFKRCIIYSGGTNLLSFSNLGLWKKTVDPESTLRYPSDTGDYYPTHEFGTYPQVKMITFGLKLTL